MNMEQTINTWVVAALRFAQTNECRRLSGPSAVQRFAALMKADWVPDETEVAGMRKIVPGSPVSPRIG